MQIQSNQKFSIVNISKRQITKLWVNVLLIWRQLISESICSNKGKMCHVKETILETIALQRVGSLEKHLINKYRVDSVLRSQVFRENSEILSESRIFIIKSTPIWKICLKTTRVWVCFILNGSNIAFFCPRYFKTLISYFEVFYLHLIQLSLI